MDKPVEIRPVWESKINTAAQIALAGFALGARAYGLNPATLCKPISNGRSPRQPWPQAASISPNGSTT